MTGARNGDERGLGSALLARLETEAIDDALALLAEQDLYNQETVVQLVEIALARAESVPRSAAHWLDVATALDQATGAQPGLQAQIRYAQARLFLQQGDLGQAETTLQAAQDLWQTAGDGMALARSYLGLTQILTLQGRYTEAETAIRRAIDGLPAGTTQQAWAHLNRANLLRRLSRFGAALDEYTTARTILNDQLAQAPEQAAADTLRDEIADVDLGRANALMALDRPDEAESALQAALAHFAQNGDRLSRGRTRTNLGSLYLRTGRYAAALAALNAAESDLLGDISDPDQLDPARLRQADVFLLDQAAAYLALNLLPEATAALERCQMLFRTANQPYELGQSLYVLGLLRMQNGDFTAAETSLTESEAIFRDLPDPYWTTRAGLALATLAQRQGVVDVAAARLAPLLASLSPDAAATAEATAWDIGSATEARLLRLQLHLDAGEVDQARQVAAVVAETIGRAPGEAAPGPLPHLQLRLAHALGCIESAAGDPSAARSHFYAAIDLVEDQRTSLPLEEIKTAYLADKFHIYTDLVLSLLGAEEPAADAVAEAFAVVERARSRALLERLLSSVEAVDTEAGLDTALVERREALRRQLHWLYNQLLGESGSRWVDLQLDRRLQDQESKLRRLEWQSSPAAAGSPLSALLAQAQPVDLAAFQRTLPADQQALVYYIGEPSTTLPIHGNVSSPGEVMAFLVDRTDIRLFRRLCTPQELSDAQDEVRFQLGRAELGNDYLARHRAHLETALQVALHRLYQLLIAPLASHLSAPRLLLVPHGQLHRTPFHALWTGQAHLLERFECSYVPSASVAVHCAQAGSHTEPYGSLAGLALTDPAIPQARQEVALAAAHFHRSWLYLDEQAGEANLVQAATQAEILHIATHGLFRPDNPFFSALKLADGWIDVRQIYRLPLAARLVVLSACESGSGEIRGGDEVIGLARGFLGAGAQSLLVSLWNVHDSSVVDLMQTFYEHLTGNSPRPAAALRAAQLAAIRAEQHPYFWASFLAVGA